jgi:glycogen synthase
MADRVIAVSRRERERILELFDLDPDRVLTIPNGIDPEVYRKVDGREARARYGIGDGPFVLFVGRMSRQKGILHFLEAARRLPSEVGVVLVAASPDAPEVEVEVEVACAKLRRERKGFVHVKEMIPRTDAIQLYSEAAVFVCPSIYEPFGIINLEAMACETPVVASAVGGIVEVVVDGETGFLVDPAPTIAPTGEPEDPEAFREALAARIGELLADPARAARMGWAGRRRVEENFGWPAVAARIHAVYRELVEEGE